MPSPWPDALRARADLAACRAALRQGSRSFWAASLVLPEAVRDPATALYAFCRDADDVIDLNPGPAGTDAALDGLRERLDRVYAGRPRDTSVDRAFADVVAGFDLPRALPEALIDGMAWDAEGRRYETASDVFAYAARVAGTVGAMMAVLMGVRDAQVFARACDLGVAMQLSNIARDVGEDARNGRLYLPRSWLRDVGIDPDAWMAAPTASPALLQVVARLLSEADALYLRAESGIAALPPGCRPGIFAARSLYAAIGTAAGALGPRLIDTRAVVPGRAKRRLLLRACVAAVRLRADPVALGQPPLPEVRFLVDAAMGRRVPAPIAAEGRVAWVFELMERLDRPDTGARSAPMRIGAAE